MGWTSCSCRTARRSALLCAVGPQAKTTAQTGGGLPTAYRTTRRAHAQFIAQSHAPVSPLVGPVARQPLFSPERASASATLSFLGSVRAIP